MVKNIRSKGDKTDQELLNEYKEMKRQCYEVCHVFVGGNSEDFYNGLYSRMEKVEKELGGKERVEFLLFKKETEERLKKLEYQPLDIQNGGTGYSTRKLSLLDLPATGIFVSAIVALAIAVSWAIIFPYLL